MDTLPPRLTGLITAQHGLVTVGQAKDLGVQPRHLVDSGRWRAVRRGVYCPIEVWEMLDDYRGRPLLRVRAARLVLRRSSAMSHDSACLLHGLPLLEPAGALVNVTRPGRTTAFVRAGIKIHLAPFRQDQLVKTSGLVALDLARTVCDMAREHGLEAGVVAADAALRKGVSRATLQAAYEPMTCWPHVRTVRSAVDFADPGAETPLESLARVLVAELGIGDVETQFPVRTPKGTLWTDLRVGNHVFEADGKQKYLDARRGGLRTVSADDALWDEKVRERLLRDAGLGVSRIFYADHFGERRAAARERLLADVADTVSRYGPDLAPELAEQAAAVRRTSPRVRNQGA